MGDVMGTREIQGAVPPPVRSHRQATPLAQSLAAVGDRWTLLIVLACSDGTIRLNTLRNRLPGISSAVLDHHVRQMVALGLLTRERFREMPPRVELSLTESGAELLPIAAALARWGMRHRWNEQHGCEHIDPDAVLCQLPALLDGAKLPKGVLEAIIDAYDEEEEPVVYRFESVDGRLQPVAGEPARAAAKASARIRGDRAAWEAALGPRRDYAGLHLIGREPLARKVFDALPR
ncbi:MAG TPA: helix-turn-helix domain-containing protein [Solirubrobacteraceae bacterium]|jgi:DNA-binding HxlR family transcriptional regulator|nr:helix-turn-helix domain-containing protein [Solirubrobacteraceae bacterium]